MKPNRRTVLKQGIGLLAASAGAVHVSAAGQSKFPYEEYIKYDGLGLADLVKRGKVTARELLDTAIERIRAVNSKINAVVGDQEDQERLFDLARKEIKRGLPAGPFEGVPFLVKDLGFPMKGVPCRQGCKLYEDYVPESDGPVVRKFKKAGLVLFARTATPALGALPTTESILTGATSTPWDLDRNAGGSSGGTAAAVAAGIAPAGSGTDAGGSIRIPASCCGVFGLKPSRERVPFGLEMMGNLATIHALTRSVRDSAALLDAISYNVRGSTIEPPRNRQPFIVQMKEKPRRLKIALATDSALSDGVHQDCQEAARRAGRLCEQIGHHVEDVTSRYCGMLSWEELRDNWFIVAGAGGALTIDQRLKTLGRELQEDDIEPANRASYEQGKKSLATELARARQFLHDTALLLGEFHQEYDVLLTPTLGQPPVENGLLTAKQVNDDAQIQKFIDFNAFCILANATGQPAMSVPLFWTDDGLPIGVQFIGRYAEEATLFRLAAELEELCPWKDRWPKL
ncbi:MAG: amidase [Planctomycetaceae bacterium]|nr:amidase [Planctomycetaceae bacterium]